MTSTDEITVGRNPVLTYQILNGIAQKRGAFLKKQRRKELRRWRWERGITWTKNNWVEISIAVLATGLVICWYFIFKA